MSKERWALSARRPAAPGDAGPSFRPGTSAPSISSEADHLPSLVVSTPSRVNSGRSRPLATACVSQLGVRVLPSLAGLPVGCKDSLSHADSGHKLIRAQLELARDGAVRT